jgi:hypothetical protein
MRYAAFAVTAAFLLSACGHSAGTAVPAGSTTPTAAPAVASSTPAGQPETPAGAQAAARTFFALYAAGQYAAAYPSLDSAFRASVPEAKWVAVHQQCTSSTSGLSYEVGAPVMAGTAAAVMKVSLSGAAAAIGREEITFDYESGSWSWVPGDTASYQGTVAQVVARMKASGGC